MSLENEILLLNAIKERPLGVRELVEVMQKRTQMVVTLIRKMESNGLVEGKTRNTAQRGRPTQLVSITILGESFLESFNKLKNMPLKSSKNDLARAKKDAEYVNRLISRGVDPIKAFLELNSLIRDS